VSKTSVSHIISMIVWRLEGSVVTHSVWLGALAGKTCLDLGGCMRGLHIQTCWVNCQWCEGQCKSGKPINHLAYSL